MACWRDDETAYWRVGNGRERGRAAGQANEGTKVSMSSVGRRLTSHYMLITSRDTLLLDVFDVSFGLVVESKQWSIDIFHGVSQEEKALKNGGEVSITSTQHIICPLAPGSQKVNILKCKQP